MGSLHDGWWRESDARPVGLLDGLATFVRLRLSSLPAGPDAMRVGVVFAGRILRVSVGAHRPQLPVTKSMCLRCRLLIPLSSPREASSWAGEGHLNVLLQIAPHGRGATSPQLTIPPHSRRRLRDRAARRPGSATLYRSGKPCRDEQSAPDDPTDIGGVTAAAA